MIHNQHNELADIFTGILRRQLTPDAYAWLNQKKDSIPGSASFNAAFAAVPRKTGRQTIQIDEAIVQNISAVRQGLSVQGWPADRLSRVWLLMHLDSADQQKYFEGIESLFPAGEVNELVALYSALPVLAHPEMWVSRCAEGVRNNIAGVLTAIMCNNPYPSENLDDAAWNQLVLKAFFTEKTIDAIIGLEERRNLPLAETLSDYAHERWAAHRPVNPQLWRCVAPFINENFFPDIQRIAGSDNPLEREAAALACAECQYSPAKQLIPVNLTKAIAAGTLSWKTLAAKTNDYVLQ